MADSHEHKHEPPRTTEQAAVGTTPPSPPAHPNPAVLDEAGSRALSEALRSSFAIVKIVMVLLVIVFFASGIFTVPSQQKAVILRFGKPVGTGDEQLLGPGLHWSFPYPIDEVVRIPIGEVQTVTSSAGWYQVLPEYEQAGEETPAGPSLNPAVDGYTITSDGSIIHTRAIIRYRITDPLKYVLKFVNSSNVIQDALDSSLFHASSQYTVDKAVREDVLGFQETVLKKVRELVNEQDLGIAIETGDVETIPPRQVRPAFDQVSIAEIDRRKARDDAQAFASRIQSTAEGEAAAIVNRGRSDATRLIQQVSSEAKYFNDQLAHYQSNPDLFRARLQAEAVGNIVTNVKDGIFYVPMQRNGKESELRLLLNQAPGANRPAQSPANGQR